MWTPPANVEKTTRLIVDANISLRMFNESEWPNFFRQAGRSLGDSFNECIFWVQFVFDPIAKRHLKNVIMRHPVIILPEVVTAERSVGFGSGKKPLEPEQQTLVDKLAHEWLRSHKPKRSTKNHVRTVR